MSTYLIILLTKIWNIFGLLFSVLKNFILFHLLRQFISFAASLKIWLQLKYPVKRLICSQQSIAIKTKQTNKLIYRVMVSTNNFWEATWKPLRCGLTSIMSNLSWLLHHHIIPQKNVLITNARLSKQDQQKKF